MSPVLYGYFRSSARGFRRAVWLSLIGYLITAWDASAAQFKVGYAERDVTPGKPVPMWGYGYLGARMSTGVIDPLRVKTVVIDFGEQKLAIMGLDMGRGPRASSMEHIRKAVKETAGVNFVLITGSHTHHGPVTELTDADGKGKGKFDDGVAYAIELENKIIEAINEAAGGVKDAKIGWASAHVPLCRNRHTKIEPKPVDDELTVIRFDDEAGKTIALVVNFSAHPTIIEAGLRKLSAEWPGRMMDLVQAQYGAPCIFMQGSAGDLSPNTSEKTRVIAEELKTADNGSMAKILSETELANPKFVSSVWEMRAFGQQMAAEVLKLAPAVEMSKPESPSLQGMDEDFEYDTRLKISDPGLRLRFELAFFRELVANFADELVDDKIRPHLTTILINKEVAIAGGSGEFFCNHSIRFKQRCRVKKALFFGYCNGHHMYFPTIEGASEGGYGGDPTVSWVAVGAGEEMLDKALINIYTMLGKYDFKMP